MSTPPIPQTTVSQIGMLSRSPGAKNLPSRPMMMPAMITPMMSTGDPFHLLGTALFFGSAGAPSGRGAQSSMGIIAQLRFTALALDLRYLRSWTPYGVPVPWRLSDRWRGTAKRPIPPGSTSARHGERLLSPRGTVASSDQRLRWPPLGQLSAADDRCG